MPLKLKHTAALAPRTSETVEAVGITIPVYPYLTAAEKLTFASLPPRSAPVPQASGEAGETKAGEKKAAPMDPVFILEAFAVFTQWRCVPEDHVQFEQLGSADLEADEISAIASAVSRLFAATRENEPEGGAEGKPEKKSRS